MQPKRDAAYFNTIAAGHLPELLGVQISNVTTDSVAAHIAVRKALFAPNGFLHAGTIVTLADTACGYGCVANLPDGASGFTTIELKSNFVGTARDGTVDCAAKAIHMGRTTQVWDATVTHRETGKLIATFRCTQMILWPKAA
ncbi:MAG: PaaI family thioesterase [Alphaproteobacteria bacterium]